MPRAHHRYGVIPGPVDSLQLHFPKHGMQGRATGRGLGITFNHTARKSLQFPLPVNTDSIMEMSHLGVTSSLTPL